MNFDITKIDKNFKTQTTINKTDVQLFDVLERPFSVHGVFHDGSRYRRLPEETAKSVSSSVLSLSAQTAGGRVRFRTDSPYVAIRAHMPVIGKMGHFALSGSAGFDLYADGYFVGTFVPPFNIQDGLESVISLGSVKMREITINFPLYSAVSSFFVGLQENAALEAATPYRYRKPIVYYGSSITQGGCASRPGNCYPAILSRRLNCDHINLGFSGSCMGEKEMAQYIAGLDMSVFVYDYDYNAPTPEHLAQTHEQMFRIIRQKNPQLPVVILSRPKFQPTAEEEIRRSIIRETFIRAQAAGDRNVYFVDGRALMALAENDGTVDGAHPNDFGFASMARSLEPVLENILTNG